MEDTGAISIVTRCLMVLALAIFLVVWLTLGFALWVAMLCRSFAAVFAAMTAVLLRKGDLAPYVERLNAIVSIWPNGLTAAVRAFLHPNLQPQRELTGDIPFKTLVRETCFSAVFYGSLYVAFHWQDLSAFLTPLNPDHYFLVDLAVVVGSASLLMFLIWNFTERENPRRRRP